MFASDYLWKALNIWPTNPGKALLRAIEARELSEIQLDAPVLDLGCGDGAFFSLLGQRAEFGIDINLLRAHSAKITTGYGLTACANARQLPFPDSFFRGVLSNSVLEHIDRVAGTLSEVHRILRRDGVLAFTVPSPSKIQFLFYSNESLYGTPGLGYQYIQHFNSFWVHKNYMTPQEWENLLTKIGFRIDVIKYYEPSRTSTFIDFLLGIRIQYKYWTKRAKKDVEVAFLKSLYFYLRPYYEARAESIGGGLLIKAVKI